MQETAGLDRIKLNTYFCFVCKELFGYISFKAVQIFVLTIQIAWSVSN